MICKKEDCTGCFGCYNVCPKNAIIMREDEYGNIYPIIEQEKCVKCNLCKKICPQLKKNMKFNTYKKVYAMHLKDNKLRKESSSGGAATAIAIRVIENKGIVYGAGNLFGKEEFEFMRISKISDLYKIKGSKYVHCYIKDTYRNIKNDLINNKNVAFFGTPCQVAGLESFLQKKYSNLLTVDIICHGVPSQKLFFEQLKELKIEKKVVDQVKFRDEKIFNLKILDKNKKIIFEKLAGEIPYYKNFLQGNIYRENCYTCKYAKAERVSDITLGDFWGLNEDSLANDNEALGISIIIINTIKGKDYLNSISELSIIDERTISEAKKKNCQLNHPMKKNWKYRMYRKYYPILGFKKTFKKMISIKQRIKNIVGILKKH